MMAGVLLAVVLSLGGRPTRRYTAPLPSPLNPTNALPPPNPHPHPPTLHQGACRTNATSKLFPACAVLLLCLGTAQGLSWITITTIAGTGDKESHVDRTLQPSIKARLLSPPSPHPSPVPPSQAPPASPAMAQHRRPPSKPPLA